MAKQIKMKKPLIDGLLVPSPEALLEAQTLIAALDGMASPRERELLALLRSGASRQEAAAQLGIKRTTVDVLCFRLKQKYDAL
jgi:DNA-binding NarL/FixJ family response regulator